MNRINLTDENGLRTANWFDADSTTDFKEDTYHDGNNFISHATGSQWNHEMLLITKKKRFILNRWSNYQGSPETYCIINKETAVEWMIRNNHYEEVEQAYSDLLEQYEV